MSEYLRQARGETKLKALIDFTIALNPQIFDKVIGTIREITPKASGNSSRHEDAGPGEMDAS
jgi:hypothetical protein